MATPIRDARSLRLLSRNGKDFSLKFPGVFAALQRAVPIGTALDGELVAFDDTGQPSFDALQHTDATTTVVFFAFDILFNRSHDLRKMPLSERLSRLASAVTPSELVQISANFRGPADRFVAAVRRMRAEGVVAKRLNSIYEPGKRTGAWTKKRISTGQEFVIGGFTRGSYGIDALVVGFYERDHLLYAARVRAGLVPATRREIYARLQQLSTRNCPFENLPKLKSGRWGQGLTADKMKGCFWVSPDLVANFEFLERTDSNRVRHIKFVGLRTDKNPRTVVRESFRV
jgi:ATP-dependent DNA ligase